DRADLGIPTQDRQVDYRWQCLPRQTSARTHWRLFVRRLCHRPNLGALLRSRQTASDRKSLDPAERPAAVVLRRRRQCRDVLFYTARRHHEVRVAELGFTTESTEKTKKNRR